MLRKLIGKSALFWCVFSIGCSASGGAPANPLLKCSPTRQ